MDVFYLLSNILRRIKLCGLVLNVPPFYHSFIIIVIIIVIIVVVLKGEACRLSLAINASLSSLVF